MASKVVLKRRIKSVKNTKQITKAMELVSASKMRRAQENARKSRDYSVLARAILSRIRKLTDVSKHPLYVQRKVKTRLLIVIASDRGLAGAYNSNVLKSFMRELRADQDAGITTRAIIVGRQAARFSARLENVQVVAAYDNFSEQPTANDIQPILQFVTEQYIRGDIDAVDIIFTDYKSSVNQQVVCNRLLPAAFVDTTIPKDLENAVFEPSVQEVLDTITGRLLEAQIIQAFLEAYASEHSMRMMAMKNATDNASELIDDLTLAYNTARQANITQELAEITSGAEAIT